MWVLLKLPRYGGAKCVSVTFHAITPSANTVLPRRQAEIAQDGISSEPKAADSTEPSRIPSPPAARSIRLEARGRAGAQRPNLLRDRRRPFQGDSPPPHRFFPAGCSCRT